MLDQGAQPGFLYLSEALDGQFLNDVASDHMSRTRCVKWFCHDDKFRNELSLTQIA